MKLASHAWGRNGHFSTPVYGRKLVAVMENSLSLKAGILEKWDHPPFLKKKKKTILNQKDCF